MIDNRTLIIIILIILAIYLINREQRENFTDLYDPSIYQAEQIIRETYLHLPPECHTTLNSNAINRIIPILKSFSFIDSKNDIFYHVDCGCGQAVLEFWLKTGITSKGITTEFSRLHIAEQGKVLLNQRTDLIPKTYLPPHNAVEYLNTELPANDANLVYVEKMTSKLMSHLFTLPNLKVIMFTGPCPRDLFLQLNNKFPKHTQTTIPTNQLNTPDQILHIFHI